MHMIVHAYSFFSLAFYKYFLVNIFINMYSAGDSQQAAASSLPHCPVLLLQPGLGLHFEQRGGQEEAKGGWDRNGG